MNAAGKFIRQHLVHHAMRGDAACAGKDIGLHIDLEMRFATLAPARMAGMLMADITHLDFPRIKGGFQL